MEYVSIPCIVVICFIIAELLKVFTNKSEIVKKSIPVLVGLLGGVLGYLVFRFYPGYLSVSNIFEAIAVGIISGLSSTGSHQIIKQLLKGDKDNETEFFWVWI